MSAATLAATEASERGAGGAGAPVDFEGLSIAS